MAVGRTGSRRRAPRRRRVSSQPLMSPEQRHESPSGWAEFACVNRPTDAGPGLLGGMAPPAPLGSGPRSYPTKTPSARTAPPNGSRSWNMLGSPGLVKFLPR